ncbi:putative RNA polymerase sigma-70 like domain, RNA polymerase sigma-H factor [Rosa chinensis]|uniref:Putative RNA polymerase sigma-70 like domain, RNA polymerase sigma-H factor n=1 Tax=Rosa chinensis TaxID=74649 RepID=A0A2P6S841_ROSCH|nr:RNA polymerase sigma factor sigD, chloroplastic isoform X1 [Rosa chinensis]PRQ54819.1 putative RNA polymerase sigma-70 like domain, RNA polymerase sigma-H factor [Rosa chinensis]
MDMAPNTKYLQNTTSLVHSSLITLLLCCMAITTGICSSPNQPPTLPTLSLSNISPLKTHLPFPSSKFGANLVSNDALVNGAAAEAVALARAVAEVTRDAVAVREGISEVWSCNESGNESGGGLMARRKKRRRRRKGLECFDDEERKREFEDERVSFGVVRYGYLSPREEAECCQSLKEGAKLESERTRVTEAQEHEPTSKQLANVMRVKMRSIDKVIRNRRESQERIIKSYRGLVVSVASSYQGKGLSLEDLIQEGSIGLLRGAEKFDPERGFKLSTYVYWWIRQAIIRAIEKKSRIIRLPGHICGVMAKITKAKNSFNQRFHRLPSHEEIAEMVNIQASTVRLVCERSRLPLSLDRVVTDQGCMALQDIIRGPNEMMPETMLRKQLMKQEVEKLLKTLSDREANVLRLHFGLNGETPQSFKEIGRLLELSRERVRQINGIALSKLKQTSTLDNLKLYIV